MPASVATHSTAKARQEIAAIYARHARAFLKKDLSVMQNALSTDYLYHFRGESISREQSLQISHFQMRFFGANYNGLSIKFVSANTKIKSFQWRGNDAIVWFESKSVASASYQGRSRRSESVSYGREFWTPTSQGWKLRQTYVQSIRVWGNGQKVFDSDEL